MILSGWKRSATRRAKSRITRMGMSAPQYTRSGVSVDERVSFFAMTALYLARRHALTFSSARNAPSSSRCPASGANMLLRAVRGS